MYIASIKLVIRLMCWELPTIAWIIVITDGMYRFMYDLQQCLFHLQQDRFCWICHAGRPHRSGRPFISQLSERDAVRCVRPECWMDTMYRLNNTMVRANVLIWLARLKQLSNQVIADATAAPAR